MKEKTEGFLRFSVMEVRCSMSFVKYRLKEVAADFGVTPKQISDIISRYYDKPKSNTQVLSDQELNAVFDYMTQKHPIDSLEQVFAAKKPEPPKAAPQPQPQAAPAPQQQGKAQQRRKNPLHKISPIVVVLKI